MWSRAAAEGFARCFSGVRIVAVAACMIAPAYALNFEPGGAHRQSLNSSAAKMAATSVSENVVDSALSDVENSWRKFRGIRARESAASFLSFGDLLQVPEGAARNDSLLHLFGQDATYENSGSKLLDRSSQCYKDLESNKDRSYEALPLEHVCEKKAKVELPGGAFGRKGVAFVFPVYGESIFDEHFNCALCVGILSLLCSGTQEIPIIVMHTPEVADWQLKIVSSVFPVRLKEVQPIELNDICKRQAKDIPRLQHVLMKLWYWGFTDYKQIMVMDADVLVVNPLDDLVTHPLEGAPIGAAIDTGMMRCTDPRSPYGYLQVDDANSNGGVIVAKPSLHTLNKLLKEVPLMRDCGQVVEQSLLWKTFTKRVELPPGYNCRHTHMQKCCQELSPIKIMHFAGPVKAWGPELAPQFWTPGGPAESYIRLWNYLHYQFLGHLCSTSS